MTTEQAESLLQDKLGMSPDELKERMAESKDSILDTVIAAEAMDGRSIAEMVEMYKKSEGDIYSLLINTFNFDIIDGKPVPRS